MGELEELKSILQMTLSAVNSNMEMQKQMMDRLEEENKELRQVIINMSNNISANNNYNKNLQRNINLETIKDPIKKEVLVKLRRNKKRLIKNKILEAIKFKEISIPELKEIIVDHSRYCSKASFYRYIEEMKRHDFIHINSGNLVKIKPLVEAI